MTEPQKERRKTDYEVRVIFGLLSVIMGGIVWWMTKIDAKAEKIPVLENMVITMNVDIGEIKKDVKSLLSRR